MPYVRMGLTPTQAAAAISRRTGGVGSYSWLGSDCSSKWSLLDPSAWLSCLPQDVANVTGYSSVIYSGLDNPPAPATVAPPTPDQAAATDSAGELAAAAQATTDANLRAFYTQQAAALTAKCKSAGLLAALDPACAGSGVNPLGDFFSQYGLLIALGVGSLVLLPYVLPARGRR
jgi:hypothetical protein